MLTNYFPLKGFKWIQKFIEKNYTAFILELHVQKVEHHYIAFVLRIMSVIQLIGKHLVGVSVCNNLYCLMKLHSIMVVSY